LASRAWENESRKTTEKTAGPAEKDRIYSVYGEVIRSVISFGSGQIATSDPIRLIIPLNNEEKKPN
jgi:hypothetical protein